MLLTPYSNLSIIVWNFDLKNYKIKGKKYRLNTRKSPTIDWSRFLTLEKLVKTKKVKQILNHIETYNKCYVSMWF
ncbi:hypothetical protein CGC54_07200 [Capnocytophaga canimorsus]|uniref:Uncharacterized protein n=1 Tax=Capnocytophaga canimorsus TaxID=28188 RepID=A0AAC9Z497_9FLAO|nr:hypothetical protein CGC54_07200 [Capnocytophaga canimorsus]